VSGRATRRAFLGGGVALAAGVGVAKLPGALTRERQTLAFDVRDLTADGSAPAFGTLLPGSAPSNALAGDLIPRGSKRRAGRLAITPVTTDSGVLQVHTLDLADGQLVALGPDSDTVFPVASGTGAFKRASGHVTIRQAPRGALSVDVDLEL
jgi:hypothetical protein